MAELVVCVEVNAPVERVWSALVDWPAHDRWMLLTAADRVSETGADGADIAADDADGIGTRVVAVTRLGPALLRDPMTVTSWQPPPAEPARCVVAHTGNVLRGSGAFEVERLSEGRSRVVWSEWPRLPFGLLGQLGWLGVRPLGALFLRVSLKRLAKLVESS